MSLFPLDRLLDRLITTGAITVIDTDGSSRTFGRPDAGPSVTLKIHDPSFIRRFALRPGLVVGEGYMNGDYTIEEGTLRDTFEIVLSSPNWREPSGFLSSSVLRAAKLLQRNDGDRAAKNVRHHYDIDHALYETFLDEDMQYSCAYWRDGVDNLEQAQVDKKKHIARKLQLEPGMRVLDIGCGWGGMALYLAREHDVTVTGVTLSTDQYETALRRAQKEGLTDRVTFKLLDYRDEPASYDRVVSVGMFEHVGRRNFAEFFEHLDRLLNPDGVALLHTIGRAAPPAPINEWMRQYIFPGSYLPSLSEIAPLLERRGLWLTDFEMLRLHYAKTLAAWSERFQTHRSEIAERFDERFCRMWEYYLQLCESAFRHRSLVVFQLQIAKDIETLPITRDYIYSESGAAKRRAPPQRKRPTSRRSSAGTPKKAKSAGVKASAAKTGTKRRPAARRAKADAPGG